MSHAFIFNISTNYFIQWNNDCAGGLTRIPGAAHRWAVSGWSGSILPGASCRQSASAAELRVFLRLEMERELWVFSSMLQNQPVAAVRTPSGRRGTEARQLRLGTTQSDYFLILWPLRWIHPHHNSWKVRHYSVIFSLKLKLFVWFKIMVSK